MELQLALQAGGGVLRRRDHPELRTALDRGLRTGLIVGVLPGVVAHHTVAGTFEARCLAAVRWRPDAVVTGRAAARLTFWPDLNAPIIDVAVGSRVQCRRPGYRLSERSVPLDLMTVASGVRVTTPTATALDLIPAVGGDAIDRALRLRVTTLAALRRAMELTAGRRGNVDRRRILLDSRDEPWSAAERLGHQVFRNAGITGWRTNRYVRAQGRGCYVDILFDALGIAVEIDGREFHDTPVAFEEDRARQNDLVLSGYLVLRFTWAMLRDDPDAVVRDVQKAIAMRQNIVSMGRTLRRSA